MSSPKGQTITGCEILTKDNITSVMDVTSKFHNDYWSKSHTLAIHMSRVFNCISPIS